MRTWRRREAQVSSSDLEDLSEQALIQGPGLVTAVLPAGEADAKRGIGRKLEAIEAGSLTYGPSKLVLRPTPGFSCRSKSCWHG
jgi:hypothetical protein